MTAKSKENPYRPGTAIWSVMEGDWKDMTQRQIAEALKVSTQAVRANICRIKQETGYQVPFAKEWEEKSVRPEPKAFPLPQKRIAVRCSTCGNKECRSRFAAVEWRHCGDWQPGREEMKGDG